VTAGSASSLLGASNTAAWRIERARGLAQRRSSYGCVQQRHTFLPALPGPGQFDVITEELQGYAAAENLALLAYSPLLAWLLHSDPPVIPIPGASSVAQLDEILAAIELKLDDAQLARLAGEGALAVSPSGSPRPGHPPMHS
jgi:aryl-alcohol dehydrogenase-like predicted oxidoreductase